MRSINDSGLERIAQKTAAEETGYQGWKNYETWTVALWLDNDEGSSDYWREQAAEAQRSAPAGSGEDQPTSAAWTPDEEARFALADQLKQHHEDMVEELGVQGVFADLLNAALSEVNWDEIAEHFISKA